MTPFPKPDAPHAAGHTTAPGGPNPVVLVKKYSNRRLYDTEQSRYITLDELAERIRSGSDVRVVDARSGEDLTQATLAQVVIEGRGAGKLLPAPLLHEMIRMGDGALAEFLGTWVGWALTLYGQARRQGRAIASLNPFFGGGPWGTTPWGGWQPPWGGGAPQSPPQPAPPVAPGYAGPVGVGPVGGGPDGGAPADHGHGADGPGASGTSTKDDLAELRAEIAALREAVKGARGDD